MRAAPAEVAAVPPLAIGSAPVTLEVRSMLPASIALVIVDQAGSVPLVVSTVLADPIARRSAADAPCLSRSPRVVRALTPGPAGPVLPVSPVVPLSPVRAKERRILSPSPNVPWLST